MKKKIVLIILILSLGVNLYMLGKWFFNDLWYEPNLEEKVILSEMIQKTVGSEDYNKLKTENIIAIDTSVDKNKGGVFPYYFRVMVHTDKQTHLFSCNDKQCSKMKIDGITSSIYEYEEESKRLPFDSRE